MVKIIADEAIPYLQLTAPEAVEMIRLPSHHITKENIKDADALLIRTRTVCDSKLLASTRVRFIGTASIGFDHIDTEYCERNHIHWTNAPGSNSSAVQQYMGSALAAIAAARKIRLNEKTIGIIGVGNVGRKVEVLAKVMGMRVLLNDPPLEAAGGLKECTDFDTLLEQSDIVTLHVPLTSLGPYPTNGFINNEAFRRMKSDSVLINTSRGEVIDTPALKEAIRRKIIGAFVMDVWENEPVIETDIIEGCLIATPHIAGYSHDGKSNATRHVIRRLCEYFELPQSSWSQVILPLSYNKAIGLDKSTFPDPFSWMHSVFLSCYDIYKDDILLKQSPEKFDYLRNTYNFRRDYCAFSLNISQVPSTLLPAIRGLGFSLIDDR